MKQILLSIILLSFSLVLPAQLVITEIMYNPPESGDDTTEYIEILNVSSEDIALLNYSITQGIEMTFENILIESGRYLVITKNKDAFKDYYGYEAIQWDGGSLSNSGEDIIISNPQGDIVDVVDYDDGGDWPAGADGGGFSLELCDPFEDNNLPENWKISITNTGKIINGKELFASPGIENDIECEDLVDHTIDVLDLQFDPKNITINVGETVQWINQAGGNHNVNGTQDAYPENPVGFFSGAPSSDNWVFSFTFDVPGLYRYKCDLHSLLGMNGSIEVLPAESNKILINEIMYNDPGQNDSLSFVEIANLGNEDFNLNGFVFEGKEVNFIFPETIIAKDGFVILCKYPEKINKYFGIDAITWGEGSIKNTGDDLTLKNSFGHLVDEVSYDDIIPWPTLPDGFGYSLSLCKPSMDNNLPENWQETPVSAGFEWDGTEIFANPGSSSYCEFEIGEISQTDENGVLIDEGIGVVVDGIIHGTNLRPGGIQLTLIGEFNDGIGLFSLSNDFGYDLIEGDRIFAEGKTSQYNGLTQINLDTIRFYGQNLDIVEPTIVSSLGEDTESQLITIQNVELVNPSEWGGGSAGFNVEVTDGNNNFLIRIDNDVDLYGMNYPTGSFDITGIGGQFDSSQPFLEGYQLIPRYVEDINPFIPNQYPVYPIGLISSVDELGKADSLGTKCEIEGLVYGINFNPFGFSFTLIDDANDGINIYSGSNNTGYEVQEGDRLKIRGVVDQYNGLTELIPDEIALISTGNDLFEALDVTELNEDTESQLIRLAFLSLVDESQWKGDGSSFNVDVINGSGEFTIRIDGDCELSDMVAPTGPFHITGIGAQYDSSAPYNEGYQLFPRYAADLDLVGGTEEELGFDLISIHPNPSNDQFSYSSESPVKEISIMNSNGILLKLYTPNKISGSIDIRDIQQGKYLVKFKLDKISIIKKLIIID